MTTDQNLSWLRATEVEISAAEWATWLGKYFTYLNIKASTPHDGHKMECQLQHCLQDYNTTAALPV